MTTKHCRKVALASAMLVALAAGEATTAQAQYAGPWIGTYDRPDGSRCYVGSWSRGGAYNAGASMQAQFCYRAPYGGYGRWPWAGAYRGYPYAAYPGFAGAYPPSFYQGYGPGPYPYRPWPMPWGF
jgi:hypothetical protein